MAIESIDQLVVLMVNNNAFSVKPATEVSDIEVDIKRGTWKYTGEWNSSPEDEEKIGHSRSAISRGTFSQPVAVYNPSDIKHLGDMISTVAHLGQDYWDDSC